MSTRIASVFRKIQVHPAISTDEDLPRRRLVFSRTSESDADQSVRVPPHLRGGGGNPGAAPPPPSRSLITSQKPRHTSDSSDGRKHVSEKRKGGCCSSERLCNRHRPARLQLSSRVLRGGEKKEEKKTKTGKLLMYKNKDKN